uniref:Uncharacterized protein n=1 Tax=Panagrolaimus davidi TaxID=227884 RepID=A0A914QMP3_9BILA
MAYLTPCCDYAYIDSEAKLDEQTKMKFSQNIYSPGSPVYETWQQFFSYRRRPNAFILVYNDQHGTPQIFGKKKTAHQKGLIMFEGNVGIFLTYSVPKFPKLNTINFEESGKAQHLLGFNIDLEGLAILSEHLWRTPPMIRYINVPEEFKRIGQIGQISAGKFSNDNDENYYKSDFKTVGGLEFKIFTRTNSEKMNRKSNSIFADLYDEFGQSFTVQTWLSGAKVCCVYGIKNSTKTRIRVLRLRPGACKQWSTGSDHSKVGLSENFEIVIFCDLNNTITVNFRGGSIYVFENALLAAVIKNTFEHCV